MIFLDTKDLIIEASLENIAKFGIDGATMKKIADDCNIKTASIYYFFKNKNDVLNTTLKVVLDKHFESQLKVCESSETYHLLPRLELLLENIVKYHHAHPIETSVYLHFINHSNSYIQKEIENYQFEYSNWLQDLLYKDHIFEINDKRKDKYKKIIDYFVLLANALFWETVVYSEKELQYQIKISKELLNLAYENIKE